VNFSSDIQFDVQLTSSSDTTDPAISFVSPTPANGTIQIETSIYVNISSNDTNDHYTFVDFDDSLILWMRMDDVNSSGDPIDLSKYGNNGSLVGNALINSTGYFGDGSHFDGDGDYIDIPGLNADPVFNDSFFCFCLG